MLLRSDDGYALNLQSAQIRSSLAACNSPEQDRKEDHTMSHPESDDAPTKRITLACLKCRSKRSRCSGDKPICQGCAKSKCPCVWPDRRLPKRRRVEIEAADRLMIAAASSLAGGVSQSSTLTTFTPQASTSVIAASPRPVKTQQETSQFLSPDAFPSSVMDASEWLRSPATEGPANFLTPFSSATQQESFLKAYETQPYIVEPDPENTDNLNVYYYRLGGSTAFHPGINRINLKLQSKKAAESPSARSNSLPTTDSPASTGAEVLPPAFQFDDAGMPPKHIYEPMMVLFFKHASASFPSISRKRMRERLSTGTMSAFFLNCICAIGARFQTHLTHPAAACAPFIAKAQELLLPLIHLPAHDVATGLILLAWAAYGQGSESGFWQYSGMALRMAIDLGIHEQSDLYESEAHVRRTKLLLWSLFITDRSVSFSTGRPTSLSEEIIEVPLPEYSDFFPDPAVDDELFAATDPVQPVAFVAWTRVMVYVGQISNVLNGRKGKKRTLLPESEPPQGLLKSLQAQLVEYYTNLPDSLKWSVDNFRMHESVRFLLMEITLLTIVSARTWKRISWSTLLGHPQLVSPKGNGTETPVKAGLQRSVRLSLASARLTTECLVYADLCSPYGYICAPIIVHPIFLAALAFIDELKTLQVVGTQGEANGASTDAFLASIDRQSLNSINKALSRLEISWPGVAYAINILHQKQAGLGYSQIDPTLKDKQASISLPDHGLIRRFTTSDPSLRPPTETSLKASRDAELSSILPPEDLFEQYTIQNFDVAPLSSFDIEEFLKQTY